MLKKKILNEKSKIKKPSAVEEVFSELKNKGLIDKNRTLIKCPISLNFQGLWLSINYNPVFENIKKEYARFVLLHEEGHIKRCSRTYLIIWIIIALVAFVFLLIYFLLNARPDIVNLSELINLLLLFLFLLLIIVLFLLKIFCPFMREDEFDADLWAATKLYSEYGVNEPHVLMKEALEEIRKLASSAPFHSFLQKIPFLRNLINFLRNLIKYHPPDEERIQYVKTYFDKRPKQAKKSR